MAARLRRTAILKLGEVGSPFELRALDVQRLYPFEVTIDGRVVAGGAYGSPLGDQTWREVVSAMARAVEAEDKDLAALRRPLDTVRNAGRQLFLSIAQLAPELRAFLTDSDPRRLVIMSARSELHALPWEAMVDEQWAHVASAGLSIVHASEVFDPVEFPAQVPLTVRKTMGPGTQRRTEPAVDELLEKAATRRQPLIVPATDDQPPSIAHIEAHGDPWKGTIDLGGSDFLDRQTSSLLVLLWSCVSNLMQPWGESLALKLHRQHNRLVLGFTTEIREDTAGDLARRFYDAVFDGKPPSDPETAIVNQRSRLYRDRLRACEWASMTVWLRGAVDLDAAVLDGPRAPGGAWAASLQDACWTVIREQLPRFATGGSIAVIPGISATDEAPHDVASDYRGAALHVRQHRLDDDLAACVARLCIKPLSVHPADRLIAIVKGLAAYPDSLLLWTGVGQHETEALQWLSHVPQSLSIALVSAGHPEVPAGLVKADGGGAPDEPARAMSGPDVLTKFEQYEAAGDFTEVKKQWDEVLAGARNWDSDRLRRLNAVGYWSFIRLGDEPKAEACLAALDGLAPVEAALLRGNLASRRGQIDEAARLYREAQRLSEGKPGDEGRALLELAYQASRRPDRGGAEALYREALSHLDQGATPSDSRWRSALGRALRDYADLLVADERRLDEAETLIERALINHALDGRMSQVATALQTRGKLAHARGRFRQAEDAIGAGAALHDRFGNFVGWCHAMEDLIDVALDAGAPQRALALASSALEGQRVAGKERGRFAALAARACWQLGDIQTAGRWSEEALASLPATERDTRMRVAMIRDVARSLNKESGVKGV